MYGLNGLLREKNSILLLLDVTYAAFVAMMYGLLLLIMLIRVPHTSHLFLSVFY